MEVLLMKIKIKEINSIRKFNFITKDLVENKEIEVVGIKDKKNRVYNIVFYNKTDNTFYGSISKSESSIENNKNVTFLQRPPKKRTLTGV